VSRTLPELKRATAHTIRSQRMRAGMGTRTLAEAAGVSRAQVCEYERGNNVPSLPVALRLADALGSNAIVDISREALTRPCKRCGDPVTRMAGRPGLYCSEGCERLHRLAHPRELVYRVNDQLTADVRAYRAAIGAMCAACPDGASGVCRMADCPLRPVSPIPLVSA
jgi:DNA-binding XRE family transcriptional regulator